MKKTILILTLMVYGMAATAQIIYHDPTYHKIGAYYYHITSDSTVELSPMQCDENGRCDNYPNNVVIPATVTINNHKYTVNRIGKGAFNRVSDACTVTLPPTIKEIGEEAFAALATLINIPDSVRIIEAYAFPSRISREWPTIHIPRFVERIDEAAFYGTYVYRFTVDSANRHFVAVDSVALCNVDTTLLIAYANKEPSQHYTLPSSIRRIAEGAFTYAKYLRSLTLPDGLREIGAYLAFDSRLNTLHIPASVCRIEGALRDTASSWFNLTVDPASTHYRMDEGRLVSYDGDTLLQALNATGEYTVPQGIHVLGRGLFFYSPELTKVNLPNGLTTIGSGAFAYSSADVSIPSSLQYLGLEAFYYNTGTTSVSLPNLTYMGDRAFSYSSIRDVDSLFSLRVIPSKAFDESSLRSINMGDQVEAFGDYAFHYAKFSPKSRVMPASLKRIGMRAFDSKSKLIRITLQGPVDTIGYGAFLCRALRFRDTTVPYCFNSSMKFLDSVYVPCGYLEAFERGIVHDSNVVFAEYCGPEAIATADPLSGFTLYPNPAHDRVNVMGLPPDEAQLTITDLAGRTMLKKSLHGSDATIDTSTLPTGIYLVTLTTQQNTSTQRLIIE